MADSGNARQWQGVTNNAPLQNGLLNESSMLSDTTMDSESSRFEPKMPRPLTLNVTQELLDWEDDSFKRKVGTIIYPLVKKLLTAKVLESERNLRRIGGEMSVLRTEHTRLEAKVWDLARKFAAATEELNEYKRLAAEKDKEQHATAPMAAANGAKSRVLSAEDFVRAVSEALESLPGAANAKDGTEDEVVLDESNNLEWAEDDVEKLNDLQQQIVHAVLNPAIVIAAVQVGDSVIVPNNDRLDVTAVSLLDFKHADANSTAVAADDTHCDQDTTLVNHSSSAIGRNLERSAIGSLKVTTNLREDRQKSALAGESCFFVDPDPHHSYVMPPELHSSDLQTVMYRACQLACIYFSKEHGDLRLSSTWTWFYPFDRNGLPDHRTALKALPECPIDMPAFVELIRSNLQQFAADKGVAPSDPDDFLASLAFFGIAHPTKAFVSISGNRVVFRRFEFLPGKHSLMLVKALHSNEACQHPVDANMFTQTVVLLAGIAPVDNGVRFDFKQLAQLVNGWLRHSAENVVVVCGHPSALCIANGSALIGDPSSERSATHLRYRSEEKGFEIYAWIF